MNKIYAVALNLHDHNTYDGEHHNQRERHTRFKHNLPYKAEAYAHQSDKINTNDYRLNNEYVKEYFKKRDNETLAFSMTAGGIRMCKDILPKEVLDYKPKKLWDYIKVNNMYFIDHHQSHATYAFINSGFDKSDILAIDGLGYKFRCIFIDKDKNIIDLTKELPLGWLWNRMSRVTGFGSLCASKLMGLAAYGSYNQYYYDVFETMVSGDITEKNLKVHNLINLEYGKENLSYTLQKFTMYKIK